MRLNKYLKDVNCKIINLTCRPDKKTYIQNHLKSRNIIYDFFNFDEVLINSIVNIRFP